MAPVGPVAVVALNGDDFAGEVDDLARLHEAERQRGRHKCVGLVVRAPQATTDQRVEPAQRSVGGAHRHKGEVVRVNIDAVVAVKRNRGLELARQVLLAIERLHLRLRGLYYLAVEPDLVIGASARRELGHHRAYRAVHLVVETIHKRLRAAHDVALDVAAAAQRREKGVVDGADRFLDVALEDSVELEVLPRGDSQRPVGPLAADLVVRDIGVRRYDAARYAGPDHQLVVLVKPLRPRLLATVAIVLLVDAVELEQSLRGVTERRRVLEKLFFNEPSKVVTRGFDRLVSRHAVEG